MSRQYNQQQPDGSWVQVTQDDNGNFSSKPINPNDYGASNIPGGTSTAGHVVPNGGATSTADQLAGLDAAAGGYWNGDRTNPQAIAAAYAAAGAGGDTTGAGGNTAVNLGAANLAAQTAYQTALIQGQSDRLAFDKATEAWNETFKQGQANNTNALSYLNLQSHLTGPANAFEYAKLLTGTPGGLADIVRAAGGAYQMPAFGGGSGGTSTPLSIQTMIDDVSKYSPTAGGSAPSTNATTGASYTTVNGTKTVDQMANELKVAGWGGNTSDVNAVVAAYGSTTKGAVTPAAATPAATPGVTPNTATPGGTPPMGTAVTPGAGQMSAGVVPSNLTGATQGTYQSQVFQGNKGDPSTWVGATPTAATGSQVYTPTSGGGYTGTATPSAASVPQNSYIPSFGPLQTTGNQIAPQNWNLMDPSQKALYLDAQGAAGRDPNDILAQYTKSLRGYGGPAQGAVGF